MSKNNIMNPQPEEGENDENEKSLRPKRLLDMIGRGKERKSLDIMMRAAKKRKESLDHILFSGPPGVGKTSFAFVVAHEMGVPVIATSGPAIERQADLASIISNIEDGSILFIDEIHRLHKSIEEILYPAMEDRCLDIVIGKGASAKTLRIDLPSFTVIGATTRLGFLSAPLRDRFGAHYQLDFYNEQDLEKIVEQKAKILEIKVAPDGSKEIASRSRGTARIAVRLLRRVRDVADIDGVDVINKDVADKAMRMYEIDEYGLTNIDRKILKLIVDDYNGGPVGVSTIAAAISEEVYTVEEFHEPFLLQAGFIHKTPRGRMATKKTIEHMGKQLSLEWSTS